MAFSFFILICSVFYITFLTIQQNYKNQLSLPISVTLLNSPKVTQQADIDVFFEQSPLLNHDVYFLKLMISTLPWVKNVRVTKEWPNKITVDIDEYEPKYRWQDLLYLNKDGTVFSIPDGRIKEKNFIHLYGDEGKERETVKIVEQFNQIIDNIGSNKINFSILAAEVNRRGAWQLLMQYCAQEICAKPSEMKVNLGKENILKRFENLVYYLPEVSKRLEQKESIIAADLRNDNGIIIKKEVIEE